MAGAGGGERVGAWFLCRTLRDEGLACGRTAEGAGLGLEPASLGRALFLYLPAEAWHSSGSGALT